MSFFQIEYNKNRILGLDIIRGGLMLNLIYAHGYLVLFGAAHGGNQNLAQKLYTFFSVDGVTCFFVLSGYLVGGLLLKTFQKNGFTFNAMLDFWIRRWLRTLPNYFLVLTILMLMATLILKMDWQAHLNYYLFLQNLYTPHPAFFPDAWSLTVEEWFYFFVPLGIFVASKYFGVSLKHSAGLMIFLTIAGCTAVRWYRHAYGAEMGSFDEWDHVYRKQIITRLDSIMYGVLAAYIRFYYQQYWGKKAGLLFALGMGLALFDHLYLYYARVFSNDWDFYTNVLSFGVLSFATLLMIPWLNTVRQSDKPVFRFITFISVISYSIYLLNLNMVQLIFMPIIVKIVSVFLHGKLLLIAKYLIYWFLTITLGTALYKYFESRVMNLRDKVDLKVKTQHVD